MMEQTHRFALTHARRTDPRTSHEAARSMLAGSEAQRESVYWALLRGSRPMTAHEIATSSGLTQVQVCRRLPERESDGRAEPTNDTRPGPTGRASRCWQLRRVG